MPRKVELTLEPPAFGLVALEMSVRAEIATGTARSNWMDTDS